MPSLFSINTNNDLQACVSVSNLDISLRLVRWAQTVQTSKKQYNYVRVVAGKSDARQNGEIREMDVFPTNWQFLS